MTTYPMKGTPMNTPQEGHALRVVARDLAASLRQLEHSTAISLDSWPEAQALVDWDERVPVDALDPHDDQVWDVTAETLYETADAPNVPSVEGAREARPELHRLYRFVTVAAAGEEVDQEWDGWWSGRNWHALYDLGVWDPQFVVSWTPLARVSPGEAGTGEAGGDRG